MRVFAVSDLHVDFEPNMRWVAALPSSEYSDDILIVAGDVSDRVDKLEQAFAFLLRTFKQVIFVPGNHDLWVIRSHEGDSFEKFWKVRTLCSKYGIILDRFEMEALEIVPLQAWYDYSFGAPSRKLQEVWTDYFACVWPEGWTDANVTRSFLKLNDRHLASSGKVLISCSHFLPDIGVMPNGVPARYRYLYPILGTVGLGRQLAVLKPDIHVYGHSHVNRKVEIGGTKYINNALGYPSEERRNRRKLVCVYGDSI